MVEFPATPAPVPPRRRPAVVPVARPPRVEGLGLASERAHAALIETVRAQGVRDPEVLAALARVPRHPFVDAGLASRAYEDVALPIGHGQTISRPSTVGRMAELLLAALAPQARRRARVLEVGTGCGYQAAVLAQLVGEVVSIERVRALHEAARAHLRAFRVPNLRLVFGDGRLGVPQAAPYDAITLAAAGDAIPDALLMQMTVGGRLLAPVARPDGEQALQLVERVGPDDWRASWLDAVRFVPLREGTR